ncbi:hypothetical protein AWZ03_013939 [Drosophila navojoa]|uniref:Sodium/calcium exchanger membrane region domain-containing protein n=1 Tax=Drosophila navojoa TaxID=7232 RepID=A0A484ASR8_DRONA|nr:hypothetical protein AWZ03_013939 [Drosophila navojoa]
MNRTFSLAEVYSKVSCFSAMTVKHVDRCKYVTAAADCKQAMNLIRYYRIMYCAMNVDDRSSEMLVIVIYATIVFFLILWILILEKYFTHIVKIITIKLNFNEYLAGIVLVAFCNAAPEMLTNLMPMRSLSPVYSTNMSSGLSILLLSGEVKEKIAEMKTRDLTISDHEELSDLELKLSALEIDTMMGLHNYRHTYYYDNMIRKSSLRRSTIRRSTLGFGRVSRVIPQERGIDKASTRDILHNPDNPKNMFIFSEFREALWPVDREQWRLKGWCGRGILLILAPLYLLSVIIIPNPDYTADKHDKPPPYHFIFAVIGFSTTLILMMLCVSELGVLFAIIGLSFNLSEDFVAISIRVLATTVGDVIVNTSLAKQGYERMAFAATFAHPILGIGSTAICSSPSLAN